MSDTRNHPKNSPISIRTIPNMTRFGGERRSFGKSFLVTVPAKLTGKGRLRKQFDTEADAESFAEQQLAGTKGLGEQFFEIGRQEQREAVAALDLCRPRKLPLRDLVADALAAIDALPAGVSLLEAAQYAGPRLRPVGGDRTVDEVVEEMITSKTNRHKTGQLRDRSLADFQIRARKLSATFGEKLIKDISGADLKKWILDLGLSSRSNANYLNVSSEVFRYSRQRKYILTSPMEDLVDDDVKEMRGVAGDREEPNILTVKQAQSLLEKALAHPDLDLLPAVTLGLFCGIRTAELMKLDWAQVHIDREKPENSAVTISAKVAKKRRIRHVTIPANAIAWLDRCPRQTGPLSPNAYSSDFRKRFLKLQQHAGFGRVDEAGKWHSTWEENGMRHSFGSYHFAAHGNSLETSRLLGHRSSDHVLFDHYRALAKKADGEAYFALVPPPEAENVVPFAKVG